MDLDIKVELPDSKQGSDEKEDDTFLESAANPGGIVLDFACAVSYTSGHHDKSPEEE